MNQLMGILDVYAYRTLVWDIYVERVSMPKRGKAPDEALIREALPRAATCLEAINSIMEKGPFLAGDELTLADLHAAPMFFYFVQAPEAGPLLERHPGLVEWWRRMSVRRSMLATESDDPPAR